MLNLLLLFFISHVGSDSLSVSGMKGGNVRLSCDFEHRDVFDIILNNLLKIIPVCLEKNCSDRVCKEGSCDVIIKNLTFSDAGKYFLHVYYTNDLTEVKELILEFHLHIHDEISVKTGEQLKMDVLWINADRVEKNSSGEWTEVWTRGHGVRRDRLTNSNETLTIKAFTSTDSGTYRVLDSEGEIWITVTVTGSKGNLNTDEDETKHLSYWILAAGLTVVLVLVVVTAVVLHRCLLRDYDQGVTRRRKERLRSGDPEALEVRDDDDDVCRGSGEQDQTLQGSGHTDVS